MRRRIRIVLPLAQVVIAAALTASNRLRPESVSSPTFLKPDWQFCAGMNAPVSLIWDRLTRIEGEWFLEHLLMRVILETIVYLALVGLLWYIVSIEMGGKGESVLTRRTGMRCASDVLAVILGGAVIAMGLAIRRHEFGSVTAYSTLVAVPYFIWGATIVAFYGHDLWACYRPAQRIDGSHRSA